MNKPFLLLLLAVYAPLRAAELPGPLVDGQWLLVNRDDVLVLDARKNTASFTGGHISVAIPVDANKIRAERQIGDGNMTRMRPDSDTFTRFMRAHGVDDDSLVVLTHRGGKPGYVTGAARLYWHMELYGFDRVALLDGGNPGWVEALGELVGETDSVRQGNYRFGAERPELVATMQQVRQALDKDTVTLIDTRELRYHLGLDKKDYAYARGHIPSSRSLPHRLLHPTRKSAKFYSRDTLNDLLESLRIDSDDELILYCNSGYEASSVWFALREFLGKPKVRVYDGSLHQWTQYHSNPMTTRVTPW
jgi:thiosulfate/3-mercaptopyruvate sulfurtransferase